MRIIQFEDTRGMRAVGIVNGRQIEIIADVATTRELGLYAIKEGNSLERQAQLLKSTVQEDYDLWR